MSTKHTPGPWWVTLSGIRGRGGYICESKKAFHYPGQDKRYEEEKSERKANDDLIAAAPDLLEALKYCASVVSGETCNKNALINSLQMARDAIRKATGEEDEKVEVPTAAQ